MISELIQFFGTEYLKLFLCLLIIAIWYIPASIQDYKTTTVSGEWCLLGWVISAISFYICSSSIISAIVLLVLFVLFYMPFDIPLCGDADLIPLGFYIATFSSYLFDGVLGMVFPFAILIVCIPYSKVYAYCHGDDWHWGCKQFVPMLPVFGFAWLVTLIICPLYIFLNVVM